MADILILTDYRHYLMGSRKNPNPMHQGMYVEQIETYLQGFGHMTKRMCYEALSDYAAYKGWFVIYASPESPGLFYKDYIEDKLLGLVLVGAILLPDFKFFRAHHNKCFMEDLRFAFRQEELKTIHARSYPSLKSFLSSGDQIVYPVVVKAAAGSGSVGVALARNERELIRKIKKISNRFYWEGTILHGYWLAERAKDVYHKFRGEAPRNYLPRAHKFIVQEYVGNLDRDYKVLIFGDKYYVLERKNRKNDFRASGSGIFSYPKNIQEIQCVLELAQKLKKEIDAPFYAMDIGYDGERCHLLEYQMVDFGAYTLQYSKWYFTMCGGRWIQIEEAPSLEREYSRVIHEYVSADARREEVDARDDS